MLRYTTPLLLLAAFAIAQPKKPAPKDAPRVLMALPFGVVPGKAARVELRGLKLENAREVRLASGKGTIKLLKKEKVAVPNMQEASKVGDSRVEVELTIPADAPGEAAEVVVVTPAGESTHKVLLDRTPPGAETEPNDGFKQAQPIKIGDTVQGRIERDKDVDVYRFDVKAGQTVTVEVFADRLGGALDSFLTVHDEAGNVVGSCDDIPGSTDSRVEFKAAKAGVFFATVIDAHDQGGPTHLYRLKVN